MCRELRGVSGIKRDEKVRSGLVALSEGESAPLPQSSLVAPACRAQGEDEWFGEPLRRATAK